MSHLLLVENDKILGENLQDGLYEYGYQATWLQSSDIAQEILKANAFDLIILGSRLPKRADIKGVQSLLNKYHTLPIILLTSYDSDTRTYDDYQKAGVGLNLVFSKPFELDTMLQCIEALLLQDGSLLPFLKLRTPMRYHNSAYNHASLGNHLSVFL